MGSADPYVCLSAVPTGATGALVHNRKATSAFLGASGWELPPQRTSKTIMGTLNPVFEGACAVPWGRLGCSAPFSGMPVLIGTPSVTTTHHVNHSSGATCRGS